MIPLRFVVMNRRTGDFWSNADGWTEFLESADQFDAGETEKFNLPIDGFWCTYAHAERELANRIGDSF